MTASDNPIPVYLELGQKRVFAAAVDWPGWCRADGDETAVLHTLTAYGRRYARIMAAAGIPFASPTGADAFAVVERIPGDRTTDFGAPNMPPGDDAAPVDEALLQRCLVILEACWQAFDQTLAAAAGRELRKGPRGGGREAAGIGDHVIEAHASYLRRIAWKAPISNGQPVSARIRLLAAATAAAVETAVRDGLPAAGPRGGKLWTPRTFVRRAAWHILDHVWEIEDRLLDTGA